MLLQNPVLSLENFILFGFDGGNLGHRPKESFSIIGYKITKRCWHVTNSNRIFHI